MSDGLIGLLIGLFFGTMLGAFLLALLIAGKWEDEQIFGCDMWRDADGKDDKTGDD